MNFKLLLVIFLLLSTKAYAGYFIFHEGEAITGKRDSCGASCSNNPKALRVTESTYNSTEIATHKIVSNTVVAKTQAEIDAETAVRVQAAIDAENARVDAIDTNLAQAQSIRLTDVENAIDNIGNLADAKVFLKQGGH